MKKLRKTASVLDTILFICQVILIVAAILIAAALCYFAAYYFFGLKSLFLESGFTRMRLGSGYLMFSSLNTPDPDPGRILFATTFSLSMKLISLILFEGLLICFRRILAPMKEGAPFQNTVGPNLLKAALLSSILGVLLNFAANLSEYLLGSAYFSPELLSKSVTLRFHYQFDLTFLFMAAVLLLLSYVFRYGEELQRLSDETL